MDNESNGGGPRGRQRADTSATETFTKPTVDDTSGFGLSMVLVTGVLLALGYYGVQNVAEVGFGQAVPGPFYLLALALLFILELSRRRSYDARSLAYVVGTTAAYGALVILAIEGAAHLWENPEAALDEFVGVAVLAVSLVAAALAYVLYLAVAERA